MQTNPRSLFSIGLLSVLLSCDEKNTTEDTTEQKQFTEVQSNTEQENLCILTAEMTEFCEPGKDFTSEDMANCRQEANLLSDECYDLAVSLMQCQIENEACGTDVFIYCDVEFNIFVETCLE